MSEEKEALVKNAADAEQVKKAEQKQKNRRQTELNDVRSVCSTLQGRRMLWRLMGHCGLNQSVWEPSARIHYNSGKQDVGHFILSEIIAADEQLFAKMMTESKGEKYV